MDQLGWLVSHIDSDDFCLVEESECVLTTCKQQYGGTESEMTQEEAASIWVISGFCRI